MTGTSCKYQTYKQLSHFILNRILYFRQFRFAVAGGLASLIALSYAEYRSRNAGYPAPPARVGSRTGARALGGGFPAELFRLLGGFTVPPWSRFQLPPRQTQRADFPHYALRKLVRSNASLAFRALGYRRVESPALDILGGA